MWCTYICDCFHIWVPRWRPHSANRGCNIANWLAFMAMESLRRQKCQQNYTSMIKTSDFLLFFMSDFTRSFSSEWRAPLTMLIFSKVLKNLKNTDIRWVTRKFQGWRAHHKWSVRGHHGQRTSCISLIQDVLSEKRGHFMMTTFRPWGSSIYV